MVMCGDSCLRGCKFESLYHILDGSFFTLSCRKIVMMLKKTQKLIKKRPGMAHFHFTLQDVMCSRKQRFIPKYNSAHPSTPEGINCYIQLLLSQLKYTSIN